MEAAGQRRRQFHSLGRLPELLGRLLHHARGLVGLQNLPLPLAEHRHQGVEAGAQPGDLAGIDPHGPRQLLVAQLAQVAIGQHVLEGPRKHVGRRLPRAGKMLRVVFLVGVNYPATIMIMHWSSHRCAFPAGQSARS